MASTSTLRDGVQHLDDWFVSSVEPNSDGTGRLANVWYSVVNDIGLFLGERAIAHSGGTLRWEFFTAGKKDIAYRRHVIMGFGVANQRYNVDFDLAVGMYGHRVVRGELVDPDFFEASCAGQLRRLEFWNGRRSTSKARLSSLCF